MENGGPPRSVALRASLSIFLVGATLLSLFFPMCMVWSNPMTSKPVMGCFLVAFSVIWLILLLYSIKDEDPFGIFLNGIFGVFLGLGSGFVFWLQAYASANGVVLDFTNVDGYTHLYQAILMLVVAFVGARMMWSLPISFILLFVFFGALGLMDLGYLSRSHMSWLGPLLGVIGAYFTYVAIAMYINASFMGKKLPLGGPLLK